MRHSLAKEDVNLYFPFVEKYDELISFIKKVMDIVPLRGTTLKLLKMEDSFS